MAKEYPTVLMAAVNVLEDGSFELIQGCLLSSGNCPELDEEIKPELLPPVALGRFRNKPELIPIRSFAKCGIIVGVVESVFGAGTAEPRVHYLSNVTFMYGWLNG